jgi:GntR family transcriptional repressor for pyruvate dehydrogenase complex
LQQRTADHHGRPGDHSTGQEETMTTEPMRRVRRVSVVDEIVEQFTQGILSGKWPPGSTLPSLRIFATETGVSMLTVREALRVLQARGLVETRHGVGTFVRSPEDLDAVPWVLASEDADEYLELVEAREVIETNLLRLAALRRTPEQLVRLRRVIADMEAARTDVSAFLEADVEFHDAMAEAADNRILLRAMRAIHGPLRRLIANRTMHHLETVGHLDGPIADHRDLVDSLEARDVEAHMASLERIMSRARDYLSTLQRQESITS